MFGKIKFVLGLFGVLIVFCFFLFVIEVFGFWVFMLMCSGVDDLLNVVIV